MIVQVDATHVAHTIAKQEIISMVLLTTRNRFTKDQVANFIEGVEELNTSEEYKQEIRTLYEKQCDYYFEIITNHAL